MKRIGCTAAIVCVLLVAFAQGWAAEQNKEWVTLDNCHYVDDKNNDGDSFRVSCGKEKDFIVRLYFVDAPETDPTDLERVREQSDYFGVSSNDTLAAGREAKEAVQQLLQKPFSIATRRASAAGRSAETRYYGLVDASGRSLAELLVARGLARTRGVRTNLPSGENWKRVVENLQTLENDARAKRLGIWGDSVTKTAEKRTK